MARADILVFQVQKCAPLADLPKTCPPKNICESIFSLIIARNAHADMHMAQSIIKRSKFNPFSICISLA